MPAFNKFDQFVQDKNNGVHDGATHVFQVALCNAANPPSASLDAVLADIVQIAYTNLSTQVITTVSSTQVAGVYSLTLQDLTLTASGAVAPFRYVVVFNQTPVSPLDPLIGWFDYGSDLTLNNGESLAIDFGSGGGPNGVLYTDT